MIIQEADLFKDLSKEAVSELTKIMAEESHEKGSTVFKAGDPNTSFYLVMDGRVRLVIGTEAQIDYTASRSGEAFGWTGMVDRPGYVATAECLTPCKLIRIEKEKLAKILEQFPRDGMTFYKRLAAAVVQRLMDNYHTFLSEGGLKGVTYGSGQVMGTGEE